jgi:DNA anti-recombination protein RmuC
MNETALSREEIEQLVANIVHSKIHAAIEEFIKRNDQRAKELSLIERIVRVEEELRALREIEIARFEAAEKRFESLQREMNVKFESLQREMNARFETMNNRFEALQKEMNARFETMNNRFEALQKEMNARFEALQKEMNARFEAVDKRFEAMDKRFEAMEKRLTFIQWFIGIGFSLLTLIVALYRVYPPR